MPCLWMLWAQSRCVCKYLHHIRLRITLSITTDNIVCTTSLDDEMKEGAHGAFTSEMMKLPQATRIETFLEGITDKSTGQPSPSSRSCRGLRTRSLMSCAQRLLVSTAGLSRCGCTLKGGIGSLRSWLRGSFVHTQTWC
jgi:hypothetical protein